MGGDTSITGRLTVAQRRRAGRLALANGLLWAIGNGMISSTLIIYLALQAGASRVGLGISLVLAAPRLVGLLRLATPSLIPWLGDRKRFCLILFAASAAFLLGLPAVAAPGGLPKGDVSLGVVVGLWCVYHVLEFLAMVAFWSWLADLVPLRIRGRFLGRRERWMVAGQASAMFATAIFSHLWQTIAPAGLAWAANALLATGGALAMFLALVPLTAMPHPAPRTVEHAADRSTAAIAAPFLDRRFRRLLTFGCWFSLVNGLTQSVQFLYPARVLGLGLGAMLAMQTMLRLGQLLVSPWLGRLADRWGNKPVMLASLPLTAVGLLFYCHATPAQPYWVAGAWVLWIAYAGINVGQPNLMLKLAPRDRSTAYVAAFHSLTGLAVAISTLAGGWSLDQCGTWFFPLPGLGPLDFFAFSFLAGAVLRLAGMLWLALIEEEEPQPAQKGPGREEKETAEIENT